MGHARRSERQTGWHHIVNRGVDRADTFWSDADRVEFVRLLGVSSERTGVEVHAYCLMSNHYHLVLHCPDGGLSEFMQYLTGVYARHANDRIGREGPVFRGRFHSRAIPTDQYLLNAVRYVHRNPLAIEGVTGPADHRWSSHRTYLGHRRRLAWLRTDVVLGLLGDDRRAFERFVDENDVAPDRLEVVDLAALDEAVWLAIGEAGDLGRAPQGLARTVAHLARDLVEPGSNDPKVRRARRLAQADARLVDIARAAVSMLAAPVEVVSDTTSTGQRFLEAR